MKLPLIVLAVVTLAVPAAAHIVAEPKTAQAGSYAAVAFRAGHGCSGGAPTTAIRVETPPGIDSARPQPKPGWTIEVEHETGVDPAKPRVAAVTWRGRLPDDQFDDFSLLMKLPAQPGVMYFPVIQTCDGAESQWTQIPDAADPDEALKWPAPALTLTSPAPAVGHNH